jgi:hypothetical protein
MTEINPTEWQIVVQNTPYIDDSKWMEEEEWLLDFAENPVFEKQPLDHIALTFLYIDAADHSNIVGVTKSTIRLDVCDRSSRLIESEFFDKVNTAKHPKRIFAENEHCDWFEKSYRFESASLYSLPISHENMNDYEPARELSPLCFHKNTAKILSSLVIFHDLYEIVVVMREEKTALKSILKTSTGSAFTKKVRFPSNISNEKMVLARRKRKTQKVRIM